MEDSFCCILILLGPVAIDTQDGKDCCLLLYRFK
jgi:hypothetical protein